VDYGSETTVNAKDVWVLPGSCTMTEGFALRCHLADIMPAGDITKWSRTACETLQSRLTSPAVCFLAPKVVYWPFKHIVLVTHVGSSLCVGRVIGDVCVSGVPVFTLNEHGLSNHHASWQVYSG